VQPFSFTHSAGVGGDDVGYSELLNHDNEVDAAEICSEEESDITSSDDDDAQNVDEEFRTATAALAHGDWRPVGTAASMEGDGEGGAQLTADDDFASAIARAAQLAGLTVVGTTVSDNTAAAASAAKGLLTKRVNGNLISCANWSN